MDTDNAKGTIIEDSFLAAFLSVRNLKIRPIKQSSCKIVWSVQGDVEKAYNDLLDDIPVPAATFIRHLKDIRNQIYLLRSA